MFLEEEGGLLSTHGYARQRSFLCVKMAMRCELHRWMLVKWMKRK